MGGTEQAREIYRLRVDGEAPPQRLTSGAGAMDAWWSRVGDEIWVIGRWGGPESTLMRVPATGGEGVPLEPRLRLGESEGIGRFGVSDDGRWLVYVQDRVAGNIWVLDASKGAY